MKGEWRCAPRGGGCTDRSCRMMGGVSTLAPRATHWGARARGSLQIHGTVRCRVRTEQNFAPTRSTAAAATMQPLSS